MWDELHYLAESQHDVRLEFKDEPGLIIPGWPGYRTRPGRSGYDPIDYQIEGYHILGRVIKMAVTGQYYTREPFYVLFILLWSFIGLAMVIFFLVSLLLLVYSFLGGKSLPETFIGVLLLVPGLFVLIGFFRFLFQANSTSEKEEEAEPEL